MGKYWLPADPDGPGGPATGWDMIDRWDTIDRDLGPGLLWNSDQLNLAPRRRARGFLIKAVIWAVVGIASGILAWQHVGTVTRLVEVASWTALLTYAIRLGLRWRQAILAHPRQYVIWFSMQMRTARQARPAGIFGRRPPLPPHGRLVLCVLLVGILAFGVFNPLPTTLLGFMFSLAAGSGAATTSLQALGFWEVGAREAGAVAAGQAAEQRGFSDDTGPSKPVSLRKPENAG